MECQTDEDKQKPKKKNCELNKKEIQLTKRKGKETEEENKIIYTVVPVLPTIYMMIWRWHI